MAYDGGKTQAGMFQWIVNRMPPHRVFAEPFAGGLGVGRKKRPALYNYGVDMDPAAISVLQSLNLPNWTFLQRDGLEWLRDVGPEPDWLVYADPPYIGRQRLTQGNIYRFEMKSPRQHEVFLTSMLALSCMVMISGYDDPLYGAMLQNWRCDRRRVFDRGHNERVECLWMNFEEPQALHDYSYLGEDRRERQDFRRMQARWSAKLKVMPRLKRLALRAAIDGAFDGAAAGEPASVEVDEFKLFTLQGPEAPVKVAPQYRLGFDEPAG